MPVSDIQQSALQVVTDPKPRCSGAQDALVSGLTSILAEQKDRSAEIRPEDGGSWAAFSARDSWWLQQGARGCSGVLSGPGSWVRT